MERIESLVGQLPNSNCGNEARWGGGVVWRGGVLLRVVVSCLQEVVPSLQGRGGGREVRGRGLGQEVVLRRGGESARRPEGFTWVQY